MPNPFRMDTLIQLRTATVTQDAMGSYVETWADLASGPRWAQYLVMRGQERLMAGQLKDATEFKLRIRRDTRVTTSEKVIVRGDTCDILGIEDNGRAGDMVLHCRKEA